MTFHPPARRRARPTLLPLACAALLLAACGRDDAEPVGGSAGTAPVESPTCDAATDPSLEPQDLLPILFPKDRQAVGEAWMTAIGEQR